jgi:hypothetical protein
MDGLSRLDLWSIGRTYILAKAKKIEAATVDVAGSNANIFVGSVSFMAHAVVRQLTKSTRDLFLATAEDEALDRWVFDRYRQTRKGASASLGSVVMSRPTATAGAGTVPSGTKLGTLNKVEYLTAADADFTATATVVSNVPVRAVQAGKQFQVGRNQIRTFSQPSLIFDQSITLTNPEPTAGGENREEGPIFKARMQDFWRTQQRGTLTAIQFGATSTLGVVSASVAEALTGDAMPARVVSAYFSDSSGVASKELADAVLANLEEFRCAGIAVLPELGTPQIISLVMQLAFAAGVDTNALAQAVRTAVLNYVNSLGVNQTLEVGSLMALLSRYASQGLITKDSTFVEPVGNVEPLPGKTLRTTRDRVTLASAV